MKIFAFLTAKPVLFIPDWKGAAAGAAAGPCDPAPQPPVWSANRWNSKSKLGGCLDELELAEGRYSGDKMGGFRPRFKKLGIEKAGLSGPDSVESASGDRPNVNFFGAIWQL